jgi:protein ImuB
MYACLHCPEHLAGEILLDVARQFSPVVERASETTVLFSIAPLRKMIGSPHQIAAEISRAGYEHKLQAHLAMASNPDTAILLAENFPGVTLVAPGEEKLKLGPIPLVALFRHRGVLDEGLLDVLHRWGLKDCEDLAALPPLGVAERLGKAGTYLHNLASGSIDRPLRVPKTESGYEEHMELEYPLSLLEPLLFLFSRVLSELCGRMRAQSRAARTVTVELRLDGKKPYHCELEFPVPVADSRTMLKLLQLHLERHPPEAAIQAFTLSLEPVEPKRVQGGIFLPPTPQPDKLQVTLARIKGMVGKDNAGTPVLQNTHRPDAFTLTTLPLAESSDSQPDTKKKIGGSFRLAIRLFRPALPARVKVIETAPRNVIATGVRGRVLRVAGPWKTSGEWWAPTFWCREEWDVELDDGALYRIYQDAQSMSWYVHGVYD